ncbi:serine protease snake-like [Teleopsis dalmanni]|uniref:serine protease snake-like n=1 Tax=Teleopsis dalmanni TaxID=139649 RepID=UPI0018CE35B0|nr:serine protease snake-like [Teleopsis dalmanni]
MKKILNRTVLFYGFILKQILIIVNANSKITFPGFFSQQKCTFSNGTKGVCTIVRDCPFNFDYPNEELKICFSPPGDQYICCNRERPAVRACYEFYPEVQYIVNGLKTYYKEFPYMIALGWKTFEDNKYDYKCGGVLIDNYYVLTAAHCANINGLEPVVVLPGGANLNDVKEKIYDIAKVIIHPEYNPVLAYNDIALIKLKEQINYDKACLCSNQELYLKNLTAIGYGHTSFAGNKSDELLKAYLFVPSNENCQHFYEHDDFVPFGVISSQMCALDPLKSRDTCQGDSGGPVVLTVNINGRFIPHVAGITSFGQNCAGDAPGIYTRVSEYLEWIETIVWPKYKI